LPLSFAVGLSWWWQISLTLKHILKGCGTPISKTFLKWDMEMLFRVKSSANPLFGKSGTLLAHKVKHKIEQE
jgi:hypothetical protein